MSFINIQVHFRSLLFNIEIPAYVLDIHKKIRFTISHAETSSCLSAATPEGFEATNSAPPILHLTYLNYKHGRQV